MQNRSIREIAMEIKRSWSRPYFSAVPYLQAMLCLGSASDSYGHDDARSIINYFLCNASTFRGPEAKVLKAELKAHLKGSKA
jgi:hypothetical protein